MRILKKDILLRFTKIHKLIKPLRILILLILSSWLVSGQYQPTFIANEGQWSQPFDYKYDMASGAVFLKGSSVVVSMIDEDALGDFHRAMHGEDVETRDYIQAHAYEVKLVGASLDISSVTKDKSHTKYNFFLGADSEKWKSGVGAYREVMYIDVYPGIDAKYYFTPEGNLKYDFVVKPKSNPKQIAMQYIGVDGMKLEHGNLTLQTRVREVLEMAPFAYQQINDERVEVPCDYKIEGDLVVFEIGNYNRKYPLIIDPELVFSTFSGSTANNFGFTATYSEDGGLYAGGIVFNDGGKYPATRGAFQINFAGPRVDVAISKFSADGSQLEYATYLGGGEDEIPYSLIETTNKKLVVFGSTGSSDFPTRPNAHDRIFAGGYNPLSFFLNQASFPQGTDVFVCVLDSAGGTLPAATLYGGLGNDGINSLDYNYGDTFRGEVVTDSVGNIYIVGSSNSTNLTVGSSAFIRVAPDSINGFVAAFDSTLSTLKWASYLGGIGEDNALSAKLSTDFQSIYIAGGTLSNDFNFPNEAYQSNRSGDRDGYIVELGVNDGNFISGTYNGSAGRDVNYFVDIDYTGDVYVFGQTLGDYPITTDSNIYQNASSSQYIHKFSSDLQKSKSSMVFGDGAHITNNISPTAFMVDECRNVYVSGWGGEVNRGANHNQGFTRNLPLTSDAFQNTTDGSDFYFMVLDASWKELSYATYFGGSNDDHVDGGTSRFSPDGTIYQAVCGGCPGNSNWPTTTNAYSRHNLGLDISACNLAAVKMEFSALEVEAKATLSKDSACVPFSAKVNNESFNGDIYQWILPNGSMINGNLDSIEVLIRGKHIYNLIAIDTMCNTIDTFALPVYGFSDSIVAKFEPVYDSCSNIFEVDFVNQSNDAISYSWNFGDGKKSTDVSPKHYYTKEGVYTVTMVAENKACGISDTVEKSLKFVKRASSNDFSIDYEPCRDGGDVKLSAWGTHFQDYEWNFGNGETAQGKAVNYSFSESGKYKISLSLKDSICQRYFTKDTVLEIFSDGYTPWMPNIFTPNGDGVNDYFGLPEGAHPEFYKWVDMKIFNRWGKLLYETNDINKPWDGTFESNTLAEGVYFYTLEIEDACSNQKEFKGFVHLMNK